MPQRRLIVLFDGTWSKVQTHTNVARIAKMIAPSDPSGRPQIQKYIAGVGVEPGLGHLLGGAFGLGLSGNIEDGYRWLCQEWIDGDDLFLFGFSRGAYSARSLGGMIRKCGLLRPGTNGEVTRNAVGTAYDFYRNEVKADDTQAVAFRHRFSREIAIQFVGVWETVGALGIPAVASWFPFARGRYRFHDTELSGIVRFAYHALALDEHRADFAPTKWTRLPATLAAGESMTSKKASQVDVEQRWFVGCHADVGGGEMSDGAGHRPDPLPDIALAWLQEKAIGAGLAFNEPFVPAPDAFSATPNDSYTTFMYGLYKLVKRPFARHIGGGVNETIDESVWRRWRAVSDYRPPSLLAALQADAVATPASVEYLG